MLSDGAKRLLKNTLRHVEIHNRMIEEAKMRRQKELLDSEDLNPSFVKDRKIDSIHGVKYDRRTRMCDEQDGPKAVTMQLQKTEKIDPDRSEKRKKKKKAKKEKKKEKERHKQYRPSNSETDNRTTADTTELKYPSRKVSDLSLLEKLDNDAADICPYVGVFKSQDPDKCKLHRQNSAGTEKNRWSRSRHDKRGSREQNNTSSEDICPYVGVFKSQDPDKCKLHRQNSAGTEKNRWSRSRHDKRGSREQNNTPSEDICPYVGVFKSQDPDKCKLHRQTSAAAEKNRWRRSRHDKRGSREQNNTSSEDICPYVGVFKSQDPDKCKLHRQTSAGTEKNRWSRSRHDKHRSRDQNNT